ncbi:MAG: succinylglutamate desuccinylase/aspartoacylase family protein, partial [Alphaproteobacteria bacterium]|nr:succinylglutamate desuccinylase/aspartoacylase family protein [Alphaproteobacteria bacterium]
AEIGGGGAIDRELLARTRAGVRRCLAHWGVLPREPRPVLSSPRLLQLLGKTGSVMAETDGIFEPLRGVDEHVRAGDPAGLVYPIGEIGRAAAEARFPADGIVITERTGALVRRGDLLYNLARPVTEAELGLT